MSFHCCYLVAMTMKFAALWFAEHTANQSILWSDQNHKLADFKSNVYFLKIPWGTAPT